MGRERDFCNHLPPDKVRGHYRAVSNGIGLHEVIREISSMQASGDRRPGKTAAVSGLDRKTYLYRRTARNGEHTTLSLLGLSHRRPSDRRAPERDQDGWRVFSGSVQRTSPPEAVPAGDDRREHRCSKGDREEVPSLIWHQGTSVLTPGMGFGSKPHASKCSRICSSARFSSCRIRSAETPNFAPRSCKVAFSSCSQR